MSDDRPAARIRVKDALTSRCNIGFPCQAHDPREGFLFSSLTSTILTSIAFLGIEPFRLAMFFRHDRIDRPDRRRWRGDTASSKDKNHANAGISVR